MDDLTGVPDRRLEEALFYADVQCNQLLEIDALNGDPEGPAPGILAVFEGRDAIRAELTRRERLAIVIEDPNEPTLEERLGPYGIEWQLEQQERFGWR